MEGGGRGSGRRLEISGGGAMSYIIGTIDFNHFILLSLTLILHGSHMVSAKQNILTSFSHTLLN